MTSSYFIVRKTSLIYASSADGDQINNSRRSIALLIGSMMFLKAVGVSRLSTITSERRCGRASEDISPGDEDRIEGMTLVRIDT